MAIVRRVFSPSKFANGKMFQSAFAQYRVRAAFSDLPKIEVFVSGLIAKTSHPSERGRYAHRGVWRRPIGNAILTRPEVRLRFSAPIVPRTRELSSAAHSVNTSVKRWDRRVLSERTSSLCDLTRVDSERPSLFPP